MRKRNGLLNKTNDKYQTYTQCRNEVTKLLRQSKNDYINSLACKLKSSTLASSDYWVTLKTFIKPTINATIQPLLTMALILQNLLIKHQSLMFCSHTNWTKRRISDSSRYRTISWWDPKRYYCYMYTWWSYFCVTKPEIRQVFRAWLY